MTPADKLKRANGLLIQARRCDTWHDAMNSMSNETNTLFSEAIDLIESATEEIIAREKQSVE